MVAEAGEFARRLPPKGRDFEACRLMTVEGLSTREAAERMGLSQTRVIQLRDRVLDWMAAELPRLETASPEQRLAVAEYLAAERLEFLYGASLCAWRQSQGKETVERKSGVTGDVSTIVRPSQGNVRYLQQAMRVAKEMGKFPIRPSIMAASDLGDDDSDDTSVEDAGSDVSPLKEDCSAEGPQLFRVDGGRDGENRASGVDGHSYVEMLDESDEFADLPAPENRPVHSTGIEAGGGGNGSPSAVAPNRHERRARRRRLEKALKRKAK